MTRPITLPTAARPRASAAPSRWRSTRSRRRSPASLPLAYAPSRADRAIHFASLTHFALTGKLLFARWKAGGPDPAPLPARVPAQEQQVQHGLRQGALPARARVAPALKPDWHLVRELAGVPLRQLRPAQLPQELGPPRVRKLPPLGRGDADRPARPAAQDVVGRPAASPDRRAGEGHAVQDLRGRVPRVHLQPARDGWEGAPLLVNGRPAQEAGRRPLPPVPAERRRRAPQAQPDEQAQGRWRQGVPHQAV